MGKPAPKVVYIAGWGRSGTTLLDNILGGIDGFFSVGELTYLWSRGLQQGFRCGCGHRVRECEIWSRVLDHPFGAGHIGDLDPTEVSTWQREGLRVRRAWRVLREAGRADSSSPVGRYRELLAVLYRAIAAVTGARVIVDSSKRPSDAALLLHLNGIRPYLIHMVRDPRAVAYSWERKKVQPGFGDGREMLRRRSWTSTAHWMTWNIAASAVRGSLPSSMQLRYEDLVSAPRDSILAVVDMLEERAATLPFVDEGTVVLGENHTVSGNPSRFKRGTVTIRSDNEWANKQKEADRWLTSALAWPLLSRYGYRIRAAPATRGGTT